jgi:protein-S-isoprenylcysteine O-methyltransferase Ste14
MRVGLIGLGFASVTWFALLTMKASALQSIAALLAATALPMWWMEHQRHRHAGDPNVRGVLPTGVLRLHRLLGLAGVIVLFSLSILAQTRLAPNQVAGLFSLLLPGLLITAILIIWSLLRSPASISHVEQLGASLASILSRRSLDCETTQVLLGWVVKAFFLPLMLAWSYVWLAQASDETSRHGGWMSYFVAGMAWMYAIDTAFATIGYMSTSRRIGAQIRSVDATVLGWLSALVCYPPLSLFVLRQWLEYKDGLEWNQWLAENEWLAICWSIAILALTLIYTLSSVVFGPRFSNLTHRGIITSGPYRYTKHPAYICKNLSWWLISVPFVSTFSKSAALLNCLALLGVNAIYWLRAKTEERHLMHDETYSQYAAWIAHWGLFARLRRLVTRLAA